MALKISNEIKVGAIAIVAIVVLILGFYYLKGKNLFKTGNYIYASFKDVDGLLASSPVMINGLRIGAVYDIKAADKNVDNVIVSIKLESEINIPNNSVAAIQASPLGSSSIDITKGNSKTYIQPGGTITTTVSKGFISTLTDKLDPITQQAKTVLTSIDTLVKSINNIISTDAKNDVQQAIANIKTMSGNLVASTATLNSLLNAQHGSIAQTMQHINAFTKNLSDNNGKINNTLSNVEKATAQFSNGAMQKTMQQLNNTVTQLNTIISKINTGEGSMGQLINDKKLYNNLTATTNSLNVLLQDFRIHPKRYVQFSVFGKKDKSAPLMRPLEDSVVIQK